MEYRTADESSRVESSESTIAEMTRTKLSYGTSGIYQKPVLVLHRTCSLYNQFYPQLEHEHSEQ
jgi:hypothetical protein